MNTRPPEWHTPKSIYLAWPFDKQLWQNLLTSVQQEFIALVNALDHEHKVILFPNEEEYNKARHNFDKSTIYSPIITPFADIWLRDTMFIALNKDQVVIPVFNGWGKKYLFNHDKDLSTRLAKMLNKEMILSKLCFEGGAIESNGADTMLTTEQCLLNSNRNPNINKNTVEREFTKLFGIKKTIWLKRGLLNDHTDGHIDTIARFVAHNKVMIMMPHGKDDPNYEILHEIKDSLKHETCADGSKLELIEVPSPGKVLNQDHTIMPASYLNFIINHDAIIVPIYDSKFDDKAINNFEQTLSQKVIPLKAKAILEGGGAFHCISQEVW